MSKLLPCPFCGEADELYPCHRGLGDGEPYAIDCLSCGFDFVPREGADVVAAWNRRTPPAKNSLRDRLAGEVKRVMNPHPILPGEEKIMAPTLEEALERLATGDRFAPMGEIATWKAEHAARRAFAAQALAAHREREGKPCATDSDRDWLASLKESGHCGEGTLERRQRAKHNDRIDRLLATLSGPQSNEGTPPRWTQEDQDRADEEWFFDSDGRP